MAKTRVKPKPKAKGEQEPKPKRLHKFKLDDFRGGAVAGMLCIEAFKDRSLLDPVQKWVADGLLEFAAGDSDVLDGVLFLKGEKPTPAIEDEEPKAKAKPTRQVERQKPAENGSQQRLPPITGPCWLLCELEFTDGLILPVGYRVIQFNKTQTHKFENGDVHATEDCVSRIARETGNRPVVSAIAGYLRVIQREFLTGDQPREEQKSFMKEIK